MHLTLKKEATRPPGMNSLQQQARFDDFVHEFNAERPHEAIAMKCAAQVYTPSKRPYQGLPDLDYPFHDRDVLVTACGRIRDSHSVGGRTSDSRSWDDGGGRSSPCCSYSRRRTRSPSRPARCAQHFGQKRQPGR